MMTLEGNWRRRNIWTSTTNTSSMNFSTTVEDWLYNSPVQKKIYLFIRPPSRHAYLMMVTTAECLKIWDAQRMTCCYLIFFILNFLSEIIISRSFFYYWDSLFSKLLIITRILNMKHVELIIFLNFLSWVGGWEAHFGIFYQYSLFYNLFLFDYIIHAFNKKKSSVKLHKPVLSVLFKKKNEIGLNASGS